MQEEIYIVLLLFKNLQTNTWIFFIRQQLDYRILSEPSLFIQNNKLENNTKQ